MPIDMSDDTMRIWRYTSRPTVGEPDIHVTSYDVDQVRAWLQAEIAISSDLSAYEDLLHAGTVAFLNGFLHSAHAAPDEKIAEAIALGRREQILAGIKPNQALDPSREIL